MLRVPQKVDIKQKMFLLFYLLFLSEFSIYLFLLELGESIDFKDLCFIIYRYVKCFYSFTDFIIIAIIFNVKKEISLGNVSLEIFQKEIAHTPKLVL